MPLQATSGAASYDAFGGGAAAEPNYIESCFATHLYTANNQTAQTITNGIDLAGKGGLVWIKARSAAYENFLADTARGAANYLQSQSTAAQIANATELTAFNSNGFSLGTDSAGIVNFGTNTMVSWTFREQPKFFDVVTYTGNGSATQTINHSLGSVPGCIIIKVTSQADDWYVYHRSLSQSSGVPYWLNLNTNAAETFFGGGIMLNATPTSTSFTVKGGVNGNGNTYVAYLFAHDAGGFGLTGTDNVISCGSFTTDGSGNATVSLGYEPQYILMKKTSGVQNWVCYDTMRGWAQLRQAQLYPNATQIEDMYIGSPYFFPTATGFSLSGTFGLGNNDTFIYIAIRRGPMRVPTSGTQVFSPIASSAATGTAQTTNFPVDMQWLRSRAADTTYVIDRLRGISTTPTTASSRTIYTTSTSIEGGTNTSNGWNNTGFSIPSQQGGTSSIYWSFGRAPGFFDEVCYTGTGSATTFNHNLSVAPELMIVKARNDARGGAVYAAPLGPTKWLRLELTNAEATVSTLWNDTAPTSTVFTVGTSAWSNGLNNTYVAYLFASCPGVSKVFNYTGNGSSQTINCGFTGGARFVMIKRTDSTGDWYVWDTARGIVANNDPHVSLNTTDAEVTSNDTIDTDSTGFVVNQVSATNVNVNGASYIGLAIA